MEPLKPGALSFLRSINARLAATLVLLGTLIAVESAVLNTVLIMAEESSRAASHARRQYTMSNRMDSLMARIAVVENPQARATLADQLAQTAARFAQVHRALIDGNVNLGIPASTDAEVREIYFSPPHELERSMQAYMASVRRLIDADRDQRDTVALPLAGIWSMRDDIAAGLDALLRHFEDEMRADLRRIAWVERGMLAILMSSLILIWAINFRPLERRVRREQARLRGITDNVADGIITLDAGGRVLSFNPAAERLFGHGEDAILGRGVGLLMVEPDTGGDHQAQTYRESGIGNALRLGPRRVTGLHADGSTIPLGLTISKMRIDSEDLFILVARDVSERVQAEEELRSSREQLQIFVRHTPAAVAMFDRDMRYLMHSDRWLTDYDLADTTVLGRSYYEVFPETPERLKAAHQRCLTGEIDIREEDTFERANGFTEYIRWEIYPWHDATGKVGGIIMFTEMITARKRAEASIIRAKRRIENILDELADAVIVVDEGGIVRFANIAASRMFGRERATLLGSDFGFASIAGESAEIEIATSVGVRHAEIRVASIDWGNSERSEVISLRDVTERHRQAKELEEKTRFLNAVLENINDGIAACDHKGELTLFNRAIREMHGLPEETLSLEQWAEHYNFRLLDGVTPMKTEQIPLVRAFHGATVRGAEMVIVRTDGQKYNIVANAEPMLAENGRKIGAVVSMQDITEKRLAQERLHQAQKMESIGHLTGGVAHDFNNILAVIMGNLQLLQRKLGANDTIGAFAEQALEATRRGAELTRQLLAFSRHQHLETEVLAIDDAVQGLEKMLRRTIGEHIEIDLDLAASDGMVEVDLSQLQSALLNLVVNARDAMPGGGRLLIHTETVMLDADYAKLHHYVEPGPYAVIMVSDTGIGMTPEVQRQAFEPFFTTKPEGGGTGLGLSMVYGFVKQSGGHINLYSEPDHGTSFRLYFPITEAAPAAAVRARDDESEPTGTETVLVVEDQESVRYTAVSILEHLGYRTLTAADGQGALRLLEADSSIDLLFTDVVMPGGLHGPALAARATRLRPQLKVLLTSGYPKDLMNGESPFALLRKPYQNDELARAVRAALDANGDPTRDPDHT